MIEIKPVHHCDAVITVPGSKSYTHRALVVSALANGESVLINALRSEDLWQRYDLHEYSSGR